MAAVFPPTTSKLACLFTVTWPIFHRVQRLQRDKITIWKELFLITLAEKFQTDPRESRPTCKQIEAAILKMLADVSKSGKEKERETYFSVFLSFSFSPGPQSEAGRSLQQQNQREREIPGEEKVPKGTRDRAPCWQSQEWQNYLDHPLKVGEQGVTGSNHGAMSIKVFVITELKCKSGLTEPFDKGMKSSCEQRK